MRIDRRFRIQITSAPDDEELVAEVWRGEEMLAELRHEAIGVAARLFPPRDGAAWDFTMDEILGVLAHEREVLGPSQISRSPSDHRDE